MRGQSVNRLGGLSWPKPRRPALLPNSRPLKCCRSMPDYPGLEPEQQQPSNTPSRASLPPTGHTADPRSNTSPTSGAPCDSPVSRVGCPVSGPKCRVSNVAWEVGAVINYTPSTPYPAAGPRRRHALIFHRVAFFLPFPAPAPRCIRGSGGLVQRSGPGGPGRGAMRTAQGSLDLACRACLSL